MCATGIPQASFRSLLMVTRFSARGSISPNAPIQNVGASGVSRTSRLNSEPKPGIVTHVRGMHSLCRRGLDAVAANEFRVFVEDVSELRDVDSVVAPVAVIIRVFRHGGHYAADADRVGVIHQIMPQHAR